MDGVPTGQKYSLEAFFPGANAGIVSGEMYYWFRFILLALAPAVGAISLAAAIFFCSHRVFLSCVGEAINRSPWDAANDALRQRDGAVFLHPSE